MDEKTTRPVGWTTAPPKDEGTRNWQMIRAPECGSLRLMIVSHQLIGRPMHFYRGRSTPHTEPTCEACDDGRRKEWKGYIGCRQIVTGQRYILEVTAHVGHQIAKYSSDHRTLKGTIINVGRTTPKANGKVWVKLTPPPENMGELGPEPDLRPILERMWQIKTTLKLDGEEIQPPRILPTGTDGRLGNEHTD